MRPITDLGLDDYSHRKSIRVSGAAHQVTAVFSYQNNGDIIIVLKAGVRMSIMSHF
jgi:hypothetical protein